MKIKELILFSNNLENQVDFYSTLLNFPVLKKTSKECSFVVGESVLTFQFHKETTPYHFAFNIPSNKITEALNWLKARVDVITMDNEEILNFENWNARAFYFYDLDNNIVEFISRKNLKTISQEMFSEKLIINISEIGIGTNNLEKTFIGLNRIKPIEIFDGDLKRFCALGNNDGLFILANRELKKWYPVNDEIFQSNFIVKGDFNFEYKEGEIIEIM